ncbi:MLP-like protein 28, putative [Theobroma cacao]|uniref:MLP-like protein 28, putative n=1 Tax=Theobroma cacao TaxID=3641 RepID=A0A061E7R2_THECC|nr:MLP-like protein 28, putative [Theobroma cacao]
MTWQIMTGSYYRVSPNQGQTMSSSLTGKLEAYVEIKASAEMFMDMLCNRPHHVSNACSDKVQACDLHDGDWGKEGSIICWSYVHDGEAKIGKEIIESIDPKNNSITFRLIEGDILKEYKSFVVKVQATPSPKGEGCVAHWVTEYEKLNEDVAHPETLLELLAGICKDMDTHLTQA